MPLSPSATVTAQSFRITFSMNQRSSSSVCSAGRNVSSRKDGESTRAMAAPSWAVASRVEKSAIASY